MMLPQTYDAAMGCSHGRQMCPLMGSHAKVLPHHLTGTMNAHARPFCTAMCFCK